MKRTRLSACRRKRRFAIEADALLAAHTASIALKSYRCDRCRQWHLTSRTKGKRVTHAGRGRTLLHPDG